MSAITDIRPDPQHGLTEQTGLTGLTGVADLAGQAGDRRQWAVCLQGLGMRFGAGGKSSGEAALDDINAQLPVGAITGVVGPDAAGKTTLMRILAGLMFPTAGTVSIFGQTPEHCAAAGQTGYMPQRFGLYEDLSVRDNLLLHARLRGLEGVAREALFARLLEFTSLAPFTQRLAGRLSGGMKQKLGIACALLGRPRILLLDEPGVGVDPQSRRELWRMVQDLCGDGMTIVWSTAYLEEAERCPHVLMLDGGKVLYQGAPEELTHRAEGRVFALKPMRESKEREETEASGEKKDLGGQDSKSVLMRWSLRPGVCDALVQGGHVRVVLEDVPERCPPEVRDAVQQALCGGQATPLPPRLEDAYMGALGGISKQPSPFAQQDVGSVVEGETAPPPLRIEAQGLTRRFGDFVAARDISFGVRAGQIFGLLGPNGAGKSTTFRMLCGLLRPSSGQCRVDGVDMLTAGSKARSRLGYMAQKFSLYQDIPVRDNVSIVADLYGLSPAQRQRIPHLMDALELTPYARKATASLPLGHKQRLALLCATLHEPPVLFLDEPTSGVDARTRREFWKHITALTRSGAAVLVTTHFMEEAEYCDAIALVYQGQIIARGTPDELKERAPLHEAPEGSVTLEEAFIAYIEAHDTTPVDPQPADNRTSNAHTTHPLRSETRESS